MFTITMDTYENKIQIVTYYHKEDLDSDIVSLVTCTNSDSGKYFLLEDGSMSYGKIFFTVGKNYIRTSIGLLSRKDAIIGGIGYSYPYGGYTGCKYRTQEHLKIIRPSAKENARVTLALKGEISIRTLSDRQKRILMSRSIKDIIEGRAEEIVDNVINKGKGEDLINLLKLVSLDSKAKGSKSDPAQTHVDDTPKPSNVVQLSGSDIPTTLRASSK